ncbi:MAG TPA: glucose 1-dehydrogenase [Bacillota bacterium]|nr:glucose 1-dehydrogenase [Bacillota bacterium]
MNLKDQIAIVTGAGQGMGRGIAEKLSQDGAQVVVAGRSEKGVEETVHILEASGGRAVAVKADVSNISDIKRIFEKCKQTFGSPDIFVANASINRLIPLLEITEEDYHEIYDINAKGTLFCLKEAGLQLNDGGRIVVVSSSTTVYPKEEHIIYSSTKAAMQMMVADAALELAKRGITVNSVLPGVTETPKMMEGLPVEFQKMIIEQSPFKRLGTPQDIAEVVAFLCSKNSQWISGQNILVNGGCVV